MPKINWRLKVYESLPSTSTLCRELAEGGAPEGLAILALHQSSGRGTKGRQWVSDRGNLFLSFLLKPQDLRAATGIMPFLTSVAIYEAIQSLAPTKRLLLKWPNDVLIDHDKISGTLIESGDVPSPWIVVGIGVNILSSPSLPGRSLASLSQIDLRPTPEFLARLIFDHIEAGLSVFESAGPAAIREAWLARAHQKGERLAIATGDNYIEGLFHGLGPEGQLQIVMPDNSISSFFSGETSMMIRVPDASSD